MNKIKICAKCGIGKSLNEFFKRKQGIHPWCYECKNAYLREWRKANTKKIDAYRKTNLKVWRIEHPGYMKKYMKEYRKDPKRKLNHNVSNAIYKSLRGGKNGKSWEKLVGYSLNQLKKHIEQCFKDGMSWEFFLQGKIHLDHKVPVVAHNFTKPGHEDFKKCWALSNLQPMWAKDNMSKGLKIKGHFQPSLLLLNSA